jgi:hypothetical protein
MSKLLDIDINEQLLEILGQFDMKLEKVEDYYFVDGLFPGIVAQAFEMEQFEASVVVQVDVHILLPNSGFVESFVGHASSVEEAIAECFEQFEVNVLHTLIMAFWDNAKKVDNGIGTEIWEINGHRWQAVVSNYGYRGSQPIEEIVSDSMFAEIEKHLKSMPLEEDIYAVRSVLTNVGDGTQVTEAMINNEVSTELEDIISGLDWKSLDSFYSVRNFILVMKLTPEA